MLTRSLAGYIPAGCVSMPRLREFQILDIRALAATYLLEENHLGDAHRERCNSKTPGKYVQATA